MLADGHGRLIHLGERECSIQRRHQKVIEESPSTAIDQRTRERMGEVAVQAARAARIAASPIAWRISGCAATSGDGHSSITF